MKKISFVLIIFLLTTLSIFYYQNNYKSKDENIFPTYLHPEIYHNTNKDIFLDTINFTKSICEKMDISTEPLSKCAEEVLDLNFREISMKVSLLAGESRIIKEKILQMENPNPAFKNHEAIYEFLQSMKENWMEYTNHSCLILSKRHLDDEEDKLEQILCGIYQSNIFLKDLDRMGGSLCWRFWEKI